MFVRLIAQETVDYLNNFQKLALAVSGGRDSMALLSLFCEQKIFDGEFCVIHINHNLRGESADKDCLLVSEYCKKHGAECLVFSENVKEYCEKNGYGIEQGARLIRREIFRRIISEGKAQRVVTAHHLQDFCESVLMHIFRGSGIGGLCGIKQDDGFLLRPLIDTSREDIDRYIQLEGVPYRDDESNFESDYTRNYLRNCVVPMITKSYPKLSVALSGLAKQASESVDFIDSLSINPCREGADVVLDIKALSQHGALISSSIFKALQLAGARVDCERVHITAIKELAGKDNGARVCLPNGFEVAKHGGKIYFYRPYPKDMTVIPFAKGKFNIGGKVLEIGDKEGRLRFDADKIPCDAVIRTRREGDIFKRFRGGTKSLGDYLTDIKFPLHKRDNVVVIAKDNQVFAVADREISDSVAIDQNTKNILYINIGQKE